MVFSTLYSFICLLFAYPAFSQDVVSVNSTETLLGALADQRVKIINLSTDIHGSDAIAWKEYKMLLIKRNVVIQSEGELKVLNFKYVPRRARLAAGKTLTFINLEVQGVQDSLDHRLLFLTHTKDAKVVFRSCRKQQAGCQALPKEEIVMRNFPRASVPGYTESRVQKVSLVNQTVHSRDAGKPLTYNGYVVLEDVVVPVAPGNDPTSVYTTIYQNTSKVCKRIADQECIDRFWITGCLPLLMNQDKDTDLLSQLGGGNQLADQPAYQSQRGNKTSMIAIAAIVPVVGVLLTALVVFWRLRSRRSGQGPSGVLDGTCPPGIRLGRMIGSGAYGQVYEGTWEDKRVAVKIVVSHGGKAFTAVNEEAKFSLSFDHKNVVKCLYYTSSVRSCDSHSGTSGRGCRSGTAWTGTSRAQSAGSAYKTANSKSGPSHLRGHDVESAAEKDQEKQSCGRRGRWDAPHPMGLDRDHQVVAGSPGMAVFDLSSAAF